MQLPSFTVPAGLRAESVHAGPRFVDAVAAALGIGPLEAPADWLSRLPREFTRREVRVMTIAEAYGIRRPAFIKSPNDKDIPALIYADGSRLPGPDAVEPHTPVLVSDIVEFTAEYRLFLLDGAVHAGSRYGVNGALDVGPLPAAAVAFGRDLLAACGHGLPSAVVVDVGQVGGRGWAVVEANAAWASGLYAADPDRALDVVLRAAGPVAAVAGRDRPFVRTAG